jgi:hypothetical protein
MEVNARLDRLEEVVTQLAIQATTGRHLPDPTVRMRASEDANAKLFAFLRDGGFQDDASGSGQ